MGEKKNAFADFWSATLASTAPDGNARSERPHQQHFHQLVGSVGGNVIFLGDVPSNALEMILRRSPAGRGG